MYPLMIENIIKLPLRFNFCSHLKYLLEIYKKKKKKVTKINEGHIYGSNQSGNENFLSLAKNF